MTVQRTGASRFAQRQIKRHRRLAPVADLFVKLPMDRLWGKFLHVIFICVMSPVMLAGLSIAAKLARARPVRVGKVTICGPQGFLDLCGASLERLASLDPMMYRRLTGVHRVWVFYDDRRQGAQLFRELRCLIQTDDISNTTSRARIVCISIHRVLQLPQRAASRSAPVSPSHPKPLANPACRLPG
jgi:hypothetical protein